jgi:hypothetical protein
VFYVGFKEALVVEASIVIEGLIPSKLTLESSVVFVPLFLGSLKKALYPRGPVAIQRSKRGVTALCSEVDPGSLAQPNAALTCPLSSWRGLL